MAQLFRYQCISISSRCMAGPHYGFLQMQLQLIITIKEIDTDKSLADFYIDSKNFSLIMDQLYLKVQGYLRRKMTL